MSFMAWWASKRGMTAEVSEAHYELMRDAYESGRIDEREACAKVCERAYPYTVFHTDQRAAQNCAESIRARHKTGEST